MAIGRLGLVSGLVVVGTLAGCGPQALAPTGDAGVSAPKMSAPPPNVSVPPPNVSVADGGTPTTTVDAAMPPAVDAAMPPASVDASRDAAPVVRPARTTLLTSADLSTAEVLAADGDGIYWVTGDNQLWMLPTGSDTPLQLAVDQTPTKGLNRSVSLVVEGNALFWSASVLAPGGQYYQNPLHRTRKTGGDVVLLANCTCWSPRLAADDGYLYFPQGNVAAVNEMIVALPLDAEPGTAPTPLAPLEFDAEPSAVAVDDQYVYWTTTQVDSTVQLDKDPLTRGDKAALLAGKKSYAPLLAGTFSFLLPSGGELYFRDYERVGRVDQNGRQSTLPLPAGNAILVLDRWVLTADTWVGASHGKIYAAPLDAVAGDGSVVVEIADEVMVAPVTGPPGLVFVDAGGHLLAVSARDLGAAATGRP